ncbi:MAG: cytochrome c biogenesis protein ResB [Verrucomicrobiae bacterium]|nr:cytochrome c biogenesis protein ResB [Verrucomicrobiae bacterium]
MNLQRVCRPLADLRLTLFSLGLLMVLVAICTVAQVRMGVFEAVDRYMRGFFVWWHPAALPFPIPVFPGGATAGLLLLLNLLASFVVRLRLVKEQAGLWLIHAGLVGFVAAEFSTGMFAVETLMQISEGQTRNYTESRERIELAIVDPSDAETVSVTAIPASRLRAGRSVSPPGLPFHLITRGYFENAAIAERTTEAPMAVNLATAGTGATRSIFPQEAFGGDQKAQNSPAAFVEVLEGDKSHGVWLLSAMVADPEIVEVAGAKYALSLRHERHYLPFWLTLRDFRHDVYPGTEIPKNFSSLVRLSDPPAGEDRDVLIYMNNPLRYGGKAFYQSGYQGDATTILQVVDNPGWLIPYVAFCVVGAGMLVQFLGHFFGFVPVARGGREADA